MLEKMIYFLLVSIVAFLAEIWLNNKHPHYDTRWLHNFGWMEFGVSVYFLSEIIIQAGKN